MPEIRPLQAGDENGIRRLFETCHGRPLAADVWAWRYEGAAMTEVAVDQGEIVGHVSALPVRLERGAKSLKAGLWVDLMIAPAYRNLTLFLDMAEANRRHCAAQGVEILFAFPNGKSFPVLKRMLGWQDCGEIMALEGKLSTLLCMEGGPEIEPIDSFGAEFDELWSRIKPKDRLCGERGSARLNWRYRARPGANYPAWAARSASGRLEGFLVAKTFDGPSGRIGDILDFWFDSSRFAADSLLNAAADHFEEKNAALVSAWALEGTPQRAALENRGLKPGGDRTYFAGRWTADSGSVFPARHLDWSLFKGDSDVF